LSQLGWLIDQALIEVRLVIRKLKKRLEKAG
jgi:hypothetical protein